ncbi:MAG: hypothetical protein ACLQVJ_08530 [Syntrophobacteraceae bacterium]
MNCEIEFLQVGDASRAGDAIIIRYGELDSFELMIVDGGNIDSGELIVEHVRRYFGRNAVISHAVLTHSDDDHASGLRTVLSELPVSNLWLNVPWWFATAARPYFSNKNWTDAGLQNSIMNDYDVISEVVEIAIKKDIPINPPILGAQIGPFFVLSPHRGVYTLLLPQFDRTPDPDQAAIRASGFWIGKAQPGALGRMFEKVLAKGRRWVEESWENERLREGGVTSASNESSVVLYGDFGVSRRVLLTGDAGIRALSWAAYAAEQATLSLQDFMFVQIPHHGSRRNVGPTILNRLLGSIQAEGSPSRFSAFVSAPKDDDTHPRMMVLNAFTRRGGRVIATQGSSKIFWGGFPVRPEYTAAERIPFTPKVEDYD